MILLAPTNSKICATSAADMGTCLLYGFLSILAYPQQGSTQVISDAPALLAADTRRINSMRLSFTGLEVDWIMQTRLFAKVEEISMWHSPSANFFRFVFARVVPSLDAMLSDNSRFEDPLMRIVSAGSFSFSLDLLKGSF